MKDKSRTEYKIEGGQKKYRVDIFCNLAIPTKNTHKIYNEYYYKWNGKLAIEIYVTHQVEDFKKYDLEKLEIPVLEIKIGKRLRINEVSTRRDIFNYREKLRGIFGKEIRGKFISDPSNKEYLAMVEYKKEIEKYKKRLQQLKSEVEETEKSKIKSTRELETLRKESEELSEDIKGFSDTKEKIEGYSGLQDKIKTMQLKITEQTKEIKELKNKYEKKKRKGVLSRFLRN